MDVKRRLECPLFENSTSLAMSVSFKYRQWS